MDEIDVSEVGKAQFFAMVIQVPPPAREAWEKDGTGGPHPYTLPSLRALAERLDVPMHDEPGMEISVEQMDGSWLYPLEVWGAIVRRQDEIAREVGTLRGVVRRMDASS